MERLKILFIIPTLKVAGAEKVCSSLCDNLDYDNYSVSLISLSNIIPLWDTLRNKEKIEFASCNDPDYPKFPWLSISSIYKFWKIIISINPDIVHSHLWGIKCIYLITFLFKKNKPKFIATIHSSEFIYTSKKKSSILFKFIENSIYKILDFNLISISDSVSNMVKQTLYHKSLIKIENGIDTNHFTPEKRKLYMNLKNSDFKDNFPIIVHVGRAAKEKRQIDIIYAIKELLPHYPKIKLILLGNKNHEQYSDVAKVINVYENIFFQETSDEVVNYLSIADIGVFPSLYEGLSLALAEMMSCGLPLIVSNIPSLSEMTENGKSAVLVPIKSPNLIAEKILFLINNPEFTKKIGQKAREIAIEKYSLNIMIEKHSRFYESLIQTSND